MLKKLPCPELSSYRVGGSRSVFSKLILNNANSITTIHLMEIIFMEIIWKSFYGNHFMKRSRAGSGSR